MKDITCHICERSEAIIVKLSPNVSRYDPISSNEELNFNRSRISDNIDSIIDVSEQL